MNVTDEVLNFMYLDKMHNVYTVCFLIGSLNFKHYTPLIYFWITEYPDLNHVMQSLGAGIRWPILVRCVFLNFIYLG